MVLCAEVQNTCTEQGQQHLHHGRWLVRSGAIWWQHTAVTGQPSAFHGVAEAHVLFQGCLVQSSSSLDCCCSGLFAQKSSQGRLNPDSKRNHHPSASLWGQQKTQLQNCARCNSLPCFREHTCKHDKMAMSLKYSGNICWTRVGDHDNQPCAQGVRKGTVGETSKMQNRSLAFFLSQ